MGSVYGQAFRISTFGESHGGGVGVVVEGCPPRLAIDVAEIQADLDRRRPGQSVLTTPRQEADRVEILSGMFEGRTLGSPIALLVRNQDARPSAYEEMRDLYRPSHADFTTEAKYGIRNWQGGGRASARETIGRVAAGAIARKLLRTVAGIEVLAWVSRVQGIDSKVDPETVQLAEIEANDVRCPDAQAAERMYALIDAVRRRGDSVGGVVECVARGVPAGLGEPVFDKLEADLAKALISLPAAQGLRDRLGLRGHRLDRQRAQRSLHDRRAGPHAHDDQPLRRHPGRHQQRRVDPAAGRLQADGHRPRRAADRRSDREGRRPRGRRAPRSLRAAARRPDGRGDGLPDARGHWLRQRAVDVLPAPAR
jgi:chorismate synthase